MVWTPLVVYGFCKSVLQVTRRGALLRTVLHQAATWAFVIAYFAWAVQLWPRLLGTSS
jgi:hypothetical protein